MFTPSTITRPTTFGEVFFHEIDPGFSRDTMVIASGSGILPIGQVLGQAVSGTAVVAAKTGGNTGNGTFVIDPTTPLLVYAETGKYTLRCITAVTNGGVFRLETPTGRVLGDVTITPGAGASVTLAEHIKGLLTEGATDFVVGDGYDITVTLDGAGKFKPHDPAAIDGTQVASAVLGEAVDATSVDARALVVTGMALVRSAKLVFKTGISAADKAGALAALSAKFIKAKSV